MDTKMGFANPIKSFNWKGAGKTLVISIGVSLYYARISWLCMIAFFWALVIVASSGAFDVPYEDRCAQQYTSFNVVTINDECYVVVSEGRRALHVSFFMTEDLN